MSLRARSRFLIRNAGLNLLTQSGLVLVFLVTTPAVVHGLGEQAYGILSLTLVVLGVFHFLDLGMSHAAVKFVSEHLARGEAEEVRRVQSTCPLVNVVMGGLGAILIAGLAPFLVGHFFRIPETLHEEARTSFYLLALSFPFVLVQGTLQGITTSLQRFGAVNLVNGVFGALQGLVPLGILLLGGGLVDVVLGLMIIRVLSCLSYAAILSRVFPDLPKRLALHRATLKRLLGFSSWIFVSSLVGPILVSSDRLLVGITLSAEAVTFYAVPFGIASRLGIVSLSLSPVLFPAFSDRAATANIPAIRSLLLKSVGLLFCVLAPMVGVLILGSGLLLGLWMGEEYELRSTLVLQLLAGAMLVNAMATVPLNALLGMGRSDIVAKAHLIELPIYLATCSILIPAMGIAGAAVAWLIRVSIDLAILSWAAWKLLAGPRSDRGTAGSGPVEEKRLPTADADA